MSCKGFINGVVNHLINQVVESLHIDISDVHGWAFAYCLKPL
jgi:hypothetical protein